MLDIGPDVAALRCPVSSVDVAWSAVREGLPLLQNRKRNGRRGFLIMIRRILLIGSQNY